MDVRDFGSLIWAILIGIAVISSILRSARRAAQNARGLPQPPQPRVTREAPPPVAPAQLRRVSPVVPSAVKPASASGAPLRMTSMSAPRRRAESIFGSGPLVARGVIALEVLGPPRALREWTSII